VNAYGGTYVILGSVVAVAVGLIVPSRVLGVTRQPLPLVWPLMVLHVTLAQLPLRDAFGALERVSVRAATSRALRAALTSLSIGVGIGTYIAAHGERELLVLCLLLTALGFSAGAFGRSDCWIWTLTVGMVIVGLVYITPLGQPLSGALGAVPLAAVTAVVLAAAVAFTFGAGRLTRRRSSAV
jgi:hypothetical protein